MHSQGAVRLNKSFILGAILVLFILCAYTFHYSPNAKHSVAEKKHTDWLNQMKRDQILKNTTGMKQDVTQSALVSNAVDQSQVSMVLPAQIPEDIHKARTMEMPHRYISEMDKDTEYKGISMALPNTQSIQDRPVVHAQNDEEDEKDDEKDDDNDYSDGRGDKHNDKLTTTAKLRTEAEQMQQGNEQTETKQMQHAIEQTEAEQMQQGNEQTETKQMQHAIEQTETEQTQQGDKPTEHEQTQHENEQTKIEQTQQGNAQTDTYQKHESVSFKQTGAAEYIKPTNLLQEDIQNHNISPKPIDMTLERVNIAQSNVVQNIRPIVQAPYRDINVPSYTMKLNSHIENPSQYKAEKPNIYGGIVSQTNRGLSDGIAQAGVFEDRNRPYQSQVDSLGRNVIQTPLDGVKNDVIQPSIGGVKNDVIQPSLDGVRNDVIQPSFDGVRNDVIQPSFDGVRNDVIQPSFDGVRNDVIQPNRDTFTLRTLLESRMKLHRALKDMDDIVNYGSANSDDDNRRGWKWKEDETESHVYDEHDKSNKFANLIMQVNKHAEPVTGTKPMRPPYKLRIEYPNYLTPLDWKSSFQYAKAPIFECVPMKTINYYMRVCIHPPAVKSEVSTKLKSEGSWEYSALRDMQIALFEHKDSILIDIGASFGVFSLAAAAMNRNAIAVEPYPSHIQVFKQSVLLNRFSDHITLFQAVVSDHRGKALIKRLGDHVDNVYIQTVEDNEPSTNYSLVVNAVTLDDIEKVCPSRVAVLKIDIPGFVKKVLEYSHYFFKYIYVTHVFMHWETSDKDLCHFLVRFFVERGYQPYSDLSGKDSALKIEEADYWTNDIVIWKL